MWNLTILWWNNQSHDLVSCGSNTRWRLVGSCTGNLLPLNWQLIFNCLNANYRKMRNLTFPGFESRRISYYFETRVWELWDITKLPGLCGRPGTSGYDQTCVLVYATHSAHDLHCRRTILVGRASVQGNSGHQWNMKPSDRWNLSSIQR